MLNIKVGIYEINWNLRNGIDTLFSILFLIFTFLLDEINAYPITLNGTYFQSVRPTNWFKQKVLLTMEALLVKELKVKSKVKFCIEKKIFLTFKNRIHNF